MDAEDDEVDVADNIFVMSKLKAKWVFTLAHEVCCTLKAQKSAILLQYGMFSHTSSFSKSNISDI